MTEKDAVKLRRACAPQLVGPAGHRAASTPAFGDWLLEELDGRRRSKAA